ncbi:MAG TPA: hypothetical protein VGS10_02660 [Terracidiphilus sp.]|nr:hypothetical protein [Terracidiphilus sp.]
MFSIVWKFFSSSLLFWEIAGYFSTVVVILGCIGEYLAEFTKVPKDEVAKHKLSKLSLIILTAGIAGELLTAVQSSSISSRVIANLEASVKIANQSAVDAAKAAVRAQGSADQANGAAGAAQARADAADEAAERSNHVADLAEHDLLKTIAALRQPNMTKDDIRKITEALRGCPNRDKVAVLVHAPFTSSLAIPIFGALRDSGFRTNIALEMNIWVGGSIHGSMKDAQTMVCIEKALFQFKSMVSFTSVMGTTDPPGSPITIELGEQPLGELPKPAEPKK